MTTYQPPFATVQVSINGGSPVAGGGPGLGQVVPAGATIALTGTTTTGWTTSLWEIYDYPVSWSTPSGWTKVGASGVIQFQGSSIVPNPPVFTLPAISLWGKWAIRLTVNNGVGPNNAPNPARMVDTSMALSMLSTNGLRDYMAGEQGQFATGLPYEAWVQDQKANLRTIESLLESGGVSPFVNSIVYVSKGGSDTTGTGAIELPFLTIGKGLTVAATLALSATQVAIVQASPGTYAESPAIPPFVFVQGADDYSFSVTVTGAVTFTAAWTAATSPTGGVIGLNMLSTIAANLSANPGSAVIYIGGCAVEGAASVTGNGTTPATTGFYLQNSYFNGGVTATAAGVISLNSQMFGSMSSGGLAASWFSYSDTFGNTLGGSLTIDAHTGGTCTFSGVGSAISGTGLTLNGAGVTYAATAGGIPTSVTRLNGAPAPTPLTSANGIGYTPTTPGNWSPVPTTVQGGLDGLAAISATHGTADQLYDTNHAGTSAEWFTVGGDLTYASHAFTVTKLQGVPFASGAPTKGQFLLATSTSSYGPVTLSGDLTESAVTAGLVNVTGLNTVGVISTSVTQGQLLVGTSGGMWSATSIGGDLTNGASAGQYTVSSAAQGNVVFGSSFVQIGTTNVSGSGDVRSANAHTILSARNAAATQDCAVIGTDSSNRVVLGGTNGAMIIAAPSGTTMAALDATGVQLFNGSTLDFGGGSPSGILSIGAVGLSAPTSMPSTSVTMWNGAGQFLTLGALGFRISSVVTSSFIYGFTALASTTGATTAGQTLQMVGQAGQAGTSGANGATGGILGNIGGTGGSSDTGAGGVGGASRLLGGTGGAATSGSGNGGTGGGVVVAGGPGGASAGGTAGIAGLIHFEDFLGGSDLFILGQAGYGAQPHTVPISNGGTYALVLADYKFPVLRLGSVSLSGNTTVTFPNAIGVWDVDISGITFNAHNLVLGSGSGNVTLTALSTNQNVLRVFTFGTNTIIVNL